MKGNASATKRGPGRYHQQGLKKASPVVPRGAGIGFVQHINNERRPWRELVAAIGRRQALKRVKAAKRARKVQQ